jgi:protein PhnA
VQLVTSSCKACREFLPPKHFNHLDDPMSEFPNCPECDSEYTYQDGLMLVCPSCAHEWSPSNEESAAAATGEKIVRDSNGNILQNGDTVIVIKDLKVKGSSSVVKSGTKVKKIRLVDGDHDIDCKIDGIGSMGLKSEFVKKA